MVGGGGGSTKHVRQRTRSIAHRYGPVCALSESEQVVLGIRYDEEDDGAAETFVVRLGPGKADALDQLAGVARSVAASATGVIFVLDEKGVVHVGGRRHKLAAPRAMVSFGDSASPAGGGVVLAGDDRLWRFSADGASVKEGPQLRARHLAASKAGIVAAADDGRVFFLDEAGQHEVPVSGVPSPATSITNLAVDDNGAIAATAGRTVLFGNAESGLHPLSSAPFEIHCACIFKGDVYISSRAHGLFVIEDKKVQPKKPSLRAHSLVVRGDTLVASSDLFVCTSDGIDFLTRDLAPFVRLAEQRMPRFVQTEDPASV